jgi:hypothetical protein
MSKRLVPLCCWSLLLTWLASPLPSLAQPATPRDELLALVPADVAFCVVVNDLRGHAQKWDRSPWVQSFRKLDVVRTILESPEARQLAGVENDLKKHFDVDWPTLRDDIFGDAAVLAYRPGPREKPELEQGMFVVRAAKPKLLARLVDRFNELQTAGGELKALDPLKHRGAVYYRRVHVNNTHFYYLHGPLLIVSGSEAMLRQAIERDLEPAESQSPWPARFRRAGADKALLTVAVNPRAIDPFPPDKSARPQSFAAFWRALDGAFLTVAVDERLEVRLTLQGRAEQMPTWAQPLFTETPPPSVLWQRFPEPAILTLAVRTDFANLVQNILETLPAADRRKLTDAVQGGLGLISRLELVRDVLPNLGPDWGICVLPPAEGSPFPQIIAALAVKPGKGPEPVDDMLFKAAQLFAGLAVMDHNRKNPDDPIKIESLDQGKVTVRYLSHAKLLPAGLRPAFAIKDGFLLLATSPDAVARFGPHDASGMVKGETPLLRLSPPELARFLRSRRDQVVVHIRDKHRLSAEDAQKSLDQLLSLLDLVDSVALSQRSEPGQASWALRVLPRIKQ